MSGKKMTIIFILLLLPLPMLFYTVFPTALAGSHKQDLIKSDLPQNTPLPEQNNRVIIDPGHGGTDSGVNKGNIVESEVTLDISKKIKAYLEEKSFDVDTTRSTDTSLHNLSGISGTLQRRELDARSNIINDSGAKIFVSIHVNSYPQHPEMSGSIVYYNPLVPQSKELSEYIQEQLNDISLKNFKRDRNNPQEADFYLLKNTKIPGVLVETAFVTNPAEYRLLSQESFRSQIAKAVADGIENYMNAK